MAVARGPWAWQSAAMANTPNRAPVAGGCLLSLSLIAGAFIGMTRGQASAGLVVGLSIGLVLLGAVWLLDRRRK